MQSIKKFKISFLIFSLAGVLFSGYLSGTKLFSSVCAFGETCPIFLGLPACYYGFIMFFLLAVFSIVLALDKWNLKALSKALLITSLVGVIFAGKFAIEELPLFFQNGFGSYTFGLPTCVMGWLFFIVVFVLSVFFYKSKKV